MIQNIWISSAVSIYSCASQMAKALSLHYQVRTVSSRELDEFIDQVNDAESQSVLQPETSTETKEHNSGGTVHQMPDSLFPDLYIWVDSDNPQFSMKIQQLPCTKACCIHYADRMHEEKLAWAANFDFIFLAQAEHISRYKERGLQNVFWMPPAFTPELFQQTSLLKKHEVAYTGKVFPKSMEELLLNEIAKRFPLLQVECSDAEMPEIVSQSKIVLNFNNTEDALSNALKVLSTGSFLLTERIPHSGIETIFTDGEELAFFDETDLLEKIAYYLDRGFLREKIASRGCKSAKAALTYKNWCEDMMKIIEKERDAMPGPEEIRGRITEKASSASAPVKKELSLEDILNYDPGFPNGRSFIIPVLDLKSQTEYNFHTMLADLENIEGDVIAVFNSPAMAELFKNHPRITYSAAISHNVGVSRAWNIGLDIARTPVSFILNSDLHITPEVIDTLETALLTLEDAAVVGVEGSFVDFLAANDIMRFTHGTFTEPMQVDNVSGFFFAVKTELFNNGTLYFENKFTPCYFEEWDLGIQVKVKQLKAYIVPAGGWAHEFNTKARTGNLHYYNEAEPILTISDRNQKLFWQKWIKHVHQTGDTSCVKSLWFDKQKQMGEEFLAANNLDEAEKTFVAIIQRDATEINALYYLGFINFMKGNKALSEQYFMKVLEINPEVKQAQGYLDAIRSGT